MENSTIDKSLLLSSLLPGDEVVIGGIRMFLYFWSGNSPCFCHYVDGKPYYYINRGWDWNTKLHHVK